MSKTLGLDLGTNSIGWALIENENNHNSLADKGVLIFSEGVKKEKGQEKSRAAERTSYRSARRLKFRRKIRKYQTLLVLAEYEMCPLTIEEVKEWRKSNFKKYPNNPEFLKWLKTDDSKKINPYYYRDKASREKIDKLKLGRAFYHMAQRRGFLSNRLDQSDKGIIEKHKPDLELIFSEASNPVKLKKSIDNFFEQFDIIEKKQKDLNEGEKKLKTLYNGLIRTLKDESNLGELKDKLNERLSKRDNLGVVKEGISELDEKIQESKSETLGQYFWKLYQSNRHDINNKIRTNYTSREDHYLVEFELICKTQGLVGINKDKTDPSEKYHGLVKRLYKAIFFQRPLKSQKGLIGKCSLEPKNPRCSVSRPEYELYRMYGFINTIKVKTPNDENFRFLNQSERQQIIPKFYRKSKPTFTFEDIKNTLGKNNRYNFKDRATVSGCPTIASLINVFGLNWREVIYESYTDKNILNRKTKEVIRLKNKDEVVADIWHVLSTYSSVEKLEDFGNKKLNLNAEKANKFSKIQLKKDYASLSLYAINKILPYLEKGLLYSHAVFMANMDKVVNPAKWKNEVDRKFIEDGIRKILDDHQEENKVLFAIKSVLSNCFDNNYAYSREAEAGYKIDILNQLKKEFGERTWDLKKSKNIIHQNAFDSFIKCLKERNFIKIKRIDEKVIDFLKGQNENGEVFCKDESLLEKLYHPSEIEKFKNAIIRDSEENEFRGLGSPDVGSIKNPMAMRALHQLKKLINTLVIEKRIDENTKVNIELSRQLNDANKRKAIEKWQNDRKELFQLYKQKIKELYKEETGNELKDITEKDILKFGFALEQRADGALVNKEDILKYSLWEEQNHICLYTGKTISLSSFLGRNPTFDIEHTLPRSRSWDNSLMNKTLCDLTFNRKDKGNKIPYELSNNEDILPRIQHWKQRYEKLSDEIQKLLRQTRGASDKEQKDNLIQKRHYLQMEYSYWKGKYDRFEMKEIKEGFKNSQAVDTGIITKYATAYLKSLFNKVYSVKGEMVAEYRKSWGLHDTFKDKQNKTQYKEKDRSNHIHHCVDAVTIASMDKKKYDRLAHAWGLEEQGEYDKAKKELEREKPWKTFTEDVRKLEEDVLIVHQNKDVLPIQTKKKYRKRGKIQYKKVDQLPKEFLNKKEGKDYLVNKDNGQKSYKIPVFQQGDTVRGSLHQDTFYGAIKQPLKGEDGKIVFDDKGRMLFTVDKKTGEEEIYYVVRKEISNLKQSDVSKIVDQNIKSIIEDAQKKKLISFNNNGAKVVGTVWQNEEKQIPLKKVRVFTPSVKSPLKDFKRHAKPFLSSKEYKQQFNVVNDENYCMAIYEAKGKGDKVLRAYEIVNNIDAGDFYKLSKYKDREEDNIALIPELHIETGFPLKHQNSKPLIIKKGQSCIILKDESDSVDWNDKNWLNSRLYIITGIDKDGIKLSHHQDARAGTDALKFMNDVINRQKFESVLPDLEKLKHTNVTSLKSDFKNEEVKVKDLFKEIQNLLNTFYKENNIVDAKGKIKSIKLKESGLTTPKGGDVIDNHKLFPYIKLKVSGFYAKIEGIDFNIDPTGKIIVL